MSVKLKKIFETPNNENYFFGYYDVPQLSKDNQNLILSILMISIIFQMLKRNMK